MVRLKTDENGMKTRIPCQIQDMRQWRRKHRCLSTPYMLFMACSNTSRRPWHGSMCCNGWCSETCRIEWTCGCRTKILRNRGKLLKAILCYSHCLFDVSNLCSGCLSCTGKDRLDLERVTQIYHGTTGEMSEKKMSATAKPEQRPEGPRTPCWLLHLPG